MKSTRNWQGRLADFIAAMREDLNWRLLLLGALICAIAAAATPYIVLKLGMSADLAYGGMFLAAAVLGRRATGRQLAIELNIIQTMINAVVGVGFMCVILGAFFYIQSKTGFNRDIGFHPAWWQISVWVFVSANLGKALGGYVSDWGRLPTNLVVIDEVFVKDAQFAQIGRIRDQVIPVWYYGLN